MIAFEMHRRVGMKHHVLDPKFSRRIGLDSKTRKCVEPIFEALQQAVRQTGRDSFHGYLTAVYRTYKEWKKLGISKGRARDLAKYREIPCRKGATPVRALIDATFPDLDPKQKSRWSRALEFAALTKATPESLPRLFRSHSGIAGCARSAAKQKPKNKS
jgi:hypothetical protein